MLSHAIAYKTVGKKFGGKILKSGQTVRETVASLCSILQIKYLFFSLPCSSVQICSGKWLAKVPFLQLLW